MPRTTTPLDPERQLMIKTKTCQRLLKEVAYYKEEVATNELKLEEMKKNSTKDIYDVKRFEQVLGESYMMVPNSSKRLQQALDDLYSFVGSADAVDKAGTWYVTADQLLQESLPKSLHREENVAVETSINDLTDGEAF